MRDVRWLGAGFLVVGLSSLLLRGDTATAQDRDVAFDAIVGQPRGLPELPPQGAWGEVINVTSRWIVIQNHIGQQFPIAIDDIQEFLVRWPFTFEGLPKERVAQLMVEAVGSTLGSNEVRTNHIDVFEGADRSLVRPTRNELLPNNMTNTVLDPGFNRFMNPWDYAGQNLLYGWAYPVPPNIIGIPTRLHVVGSVVDLNPLRVATPGFNFATVVPDESGPMSIWQITRGEARHVRKGDYAFLLPLQLTPRGLIVSQLVLYKTIPYEQFNRNR